eukprot:EG_transcript_25498
MPLFAFLAFVLSVALFPTVLAIPVNPSPFLLVEGRRWAEAMHAARRRNATLRVFYHTSTWRTYWRDVITEQILLMDGRRPANFFQGQHPFDQGAEPCPGCRSHGGLRWLPTRWASVLDLADQLYLNVAHQQPGDFEAVKELVEGLPLAHRAKLFLHLNHTVQRRLKQTNPANSSQLSVGEVSTIMALHDHCVAEHAAGREAFVLYLHSKGACCSRTTPPCPPPKSSKAHKKPVHPSPSTVCKSQAPVASTYPC